MDGQKRVKVTIDPKGSFTLEALSGFAGESCVAQTREIEIALGGVEVSEGKTNAYYDGIDDNDVMVKL